MYPIPYGDKTVLSEYGGLMGYVKVVGAAGQYGYAGIFNGSTDRYVFIRKFWIQPGADSGYQFRRTTSLISGGYSLINRLFGESLELQPKLDKGQGTLTGVTVGDFPDVTTELREFDLTLTPIVLPPGQGFVIFLLTQQVQITALFLCDSVLQKKLY